MSFEDTILFGCVTLTIDNIYDTLFLKEKMKQFVFRSEAWTESLVVRGGYKSGKSKPNYNYKIYNYCQKWVYQI